MDPALLALQQGKVIPWQEVVDPVSYQMYINNYNTCCHSKFNLFNINLDITITKKPMRHNGKDPSKWDKLQWPLAGLVEVKQELLKCTMK